MDYLWQSIGGIAGLVMLTFGADFLVRGGVSLALKFKVTPLVIGLTLVAFATSAPELVVSITSGIQGRGDVALGNVVGSNICNIALILGLSALLCPMPVNGDLFRRDLPFMTGSALLLVLFCLISGGINRWEGLFFFAGIITYTVLCIRQSRKNGGADGGEEMKECSLWLSLLWVFLGLAMLGFGAHLFVGSAVFFARKIGVSEAVIGLTVVAVGTSLPELATSVVAALKKQQDIAIGNVVGSNIFNILAILGVAPVITPIIAPGINWIDLGVMIGITLLLGIMLYTHRKLTRLEGGILLSCYVAYTAFLICK